MRLQDFPDAIAAAEKAVVKAQELVRALTLSVEACSAQIAVEVMEDKTLTNADKRRAARLEREATDPEYLAYMNALIEARYALSMAEIEARRLTNLFRSERLLLIVDRSYIDELS